MNVRIEENSLRFKISEEELQILLTGRCLHENLTFADKILGISINPQGCGQSIESKLIVDGKGVCLSLLIPPSDVQALFDMGRSREGLTHESGGMSVNVQVDLRADSRKVAAR